MQAPYRPARSSTVPAPPPSPVPMSVDHDTRATPSPNGFGPDQLFREVAENTFMAEAIMPATSETLAGTTTVFVARAISPN